MFLLNYNFFPILFFLIWNIFYIEPFFNRGNASDNTVNKNSVINSSSFLGLRPSASSGQSQGASPGLLPSASSGQSQGASPGLLPSASSGQSQGASPGLLPSASSGQSQGASPGQSFFFPFSDWAQSRMIFEL
uniref:hypothetical protein n=1 Tax=Cephaleuros parasiticus TaxID=173370 RepID=UPI001EDE2448|nr:hypothetical protein MFQ79_pgp055 [Cephaleuros parasiticus]UIB39007.1 hypothetical protein [Cephaleuros parasiticus]